jgi:cystathionine beta-lyase
LTVFDLDQPADRQGIGNMKGSFRLRTACGKTPLILAGAEMDFSTAPVIREALSAFSQRGIYGFTLPDDAYLNAVCFWLRSYRGWAASPDMIVPTLGTVFALNTAVRAFTEPGDGVIILFPSYYRHDRTVMRNGRRVVSCPLREKDGQYSLDADALAVLMEKKENRLLVLCHPHNPTGHVFTAQELQTLATLARKTGTIVFSDEIFADITAPEHPAIPFAAVLPEQTVACVSFGKTFNFTGVNHANAVIPCPALRDRFIAQRNIDHFGSIDPFFYQAVLVGCTDAGHSWVLAVRDRVATNARRLERLLKKNCPDVRMSPWEGGYIAWLDLSAAGLTAEEAADRLEKEQATLVDPGSEYGQGGERCIRLNLATQERNIDEFVLRLREVLRS